MDKIIFLNIGWMKNYSGLDSDKIHGGGTYVKEHGYGHEIYNFKPFNGYMYGYSGTKGRKGIHGTKNIKNLGAIGDQDSIDGVLVVWVSTNPSGGSYIIGWYKNATLYKFYQLIPNDSKRYYNNEPIGYYAKAKDKDCELIPLDKRVFKVPRHTKGGFGQSNSWYANKEMNKTYVNEVLDYIDKGVLPIRDRTGKRNIDFFLRQRVEKKAIEITASHYRNLNFDVYSVEKDNIGWDLECDLNGRKLLVEVKGLSQDTLNVEFTPNEYRQMLLHKHDYRISIVTNTLDDKCKLSIFSLDPEKNKWYDDKNNVLHIDEIISARMKAILQ